jgi:hypothetical protein
MSRTEELAIPASPLLSPPNIPPNCSQAITEIHPNLCPFLRIKHNITTEVNKVLLFTS